MNYKLRKDVQVRELRIQVFPSPDDGACTVDIGIYDRLYHNDSSMDATKPIETHKFILQEKDILEALEGLTKTKWGLVHE